MLLCLIQVFTMSFGMTFLAEWGDRSQIATIAIATTKDPFGVTAGGIIGHSLCTGMAVIGGKMLAARRVIVVVLVVNVVAVWCGVVMAVVTVVVCAAIAVAGCCSIAVVMVAVGSGRTSNFELFLRLELVLCPEQRLFSIILVRGAYGLTPLPLLSIPVSFSRSIALRCVASVSASLRYASCALRVSRF